MPETSRSCSGIQWPALLRLGRYYKHSSVKISRRPHFDFLALPLEIRRMVYRELLIPPTSSSSLLSTLPLTAFTTNCSNYYIVPRRPDAHCIRCLPDCQFIDQTGISSRRIQRTRTTPLGTAPSILLCSRQVYLEASEVLYFFTKLSLDLSGFGKNILWNLAINISTHYRTRLFSWSLGTVPPKGFKARVFPLCLGRFQDIELLLPVRDIAFTEGTSDECPFVESLVTALNFLLVDSADPEGTLETSNKRNTVRLSFVEWGWQPGGQGRGISEEHLERVVDVLSKFQVFQLLQSLSKRMNVVIEAEGTQEVLWELVNGTTALS